VIGDPWRVRVVPNLYPAFERQEVVVHTAEHIRTFADISTGDAALVADAWRERSRAARNAGFAYVHAFVNEGHAAGASLAHSHSQLVWLREAPPVAAAEVGSACGVCALLAAERAGGERVVVERDRLVVLAPPAGRVPYELLAAPAAHEIGAFESPSLSAALGLLSESVRALRAVEGPVPWNAWLHDTGHWHLEVLPRLTTLAGIELGAGIYVLTVSPEESAARLRNALAKR
jgi:UDPglucose--hexose-1-phosphate uridylyltransferase